MELTVRRFRRGDAVPLARMVRRSLREINGRDYPAAEIETLAARYSPAYLEDLAEEGSLYVAHCGGELVGCGGITTRQERPGEGFILALFIRPDQVGRGVGRAVMAAVEADPIFRGAGRVALHASITARGFYERLGYHYREEPPVLRDGCYPMEKAWKSGDAPE